MRHLINLRLSAILWVWLLGLCVSPPIMAQFDEPSRNQWFIDASIGFGNAATVPELSYNSSYENFSRFDQAHDVLKFGLSFGVNHRLFHNFYAGVRLGYKYSEYKTHGDVYHKHPVLGDYFDITLKFHVLNLPMEFGYNHTFTNRSGLNIYAAVQPGYCIGSGCGYGRIRNAKAHNFSVSNPGFCLDGAAGLRYFIRHVSIGAAYHYPLNKGQKNLGREVCEISLGYRF